MTSRRPIEGGLKTDMLRGDYLEAVVNAPVVNIRVKGPLTPVVGTLHADDKVVVKSSYVENHYPNSIRWYEVFAINNSLVGYEFVNTHEPLGMVSGEYLKDITPRDYLPLEDGAVG